MTRLLDTPDAAARQAVRDQIQQAIAAAQQYDTVPGFALVVPDQLTDLASLAESLLQQPFAGSDVHRHADALLKALHGMKQYGDSDRPWVDLAVQWQFADRMLAMNIFLPDPGLQGQWDWRSPYYLERTPAPGKPPIQPHVIGFLKQTGWIEFLIEYHKQVRFVGLLPALAPRFPIFNARFDPKNPGGGPGQPNDPRGPRTPDQAPYPPKADGGDQAA